MIVGNDSIHVTCAHCGAESEIAERKPGEIRYRACKQCGQIGINVSYEGIDDPTAPTSTRRKKAYRQLYERRDTL